MASERLAVAMTVPLSTKELFGATGSVVVAATVTALLAVPGAVPLATLTFRVNEELPRGSGLALTHVTVPEPVQVQPDGSGAPRVNPVGRVSVITAPAASEGPALLMVMTKGMVVPAVKAPVWVLVTERSALVTTVAGSEAELLLRTVSVVAAARLAV